MSFDTAHDKQRSDTDDRLERQPGPSKKGFVIAIIVPIALLVLFGVLFLISAKWEKFTSAYGSFEVLLPGTPETWQTEFESQAFGHTEVHHVSSVDYSGLTMCGVAYNDYPRELTDAEIEAELDHARTLPDVVSVHRLEVEGQPGIEVVTKQWPIHMVTRYVIHDRSRLYSMQIGSPQDPQNDQQKVDRFFNSFRFLSR